ncbi:MULTISPECIES: hypothetical protein [Neorhizobium]|jgi:hypothetical protein|uniref:hypothetical protein n=1 Tax=Neorhizobium sp. T6_25 TaxID=2093833 RepID=UPI00155E7A3A|nr:MULTISPECIES: hypothetical protein [Neorhizobium]
MKGMTRAMVPSRSSSTLPPSDSSPFAERLADDGMLAGSIAGSVAARAPNPEMHPFYSHHSLGQEPLIPISVRRLSSTAGRKMPGRSQSKDADLVIRSGLPNWLIKVLRQNGVRRLSRLQGMSDKELLKIPGVGARSIEMIRHELNSLQYTPDETMH